VSSVISVSGWKVDPFGSAYAMLQWACADVGAILVTVNPAYKLHELVCSFTMFFSGMRPILSTG